MIFISYRQEDTKAVVTNLSQRLKQRYGAESVFVDYSDIVPGAVWADDLRQHLDKSSVVLAVIGGGWGEAKFPPGSGNRGRLRLDDPDDWVRLELCTAVRRAKAGAAKLIVVSIDGAEMPETKWRCELDELSLFQRAEVRSKRHFEADFDALCAAIDLAAPNLNQDRTARRAGEAAQRSADSDVAVYLEAMLGGTANIQLPIVQPSGYPVIAPLDKLRIDLPLFVSHEHAPAHRETQFVWIGVDPLTIHDKLRSSHTSALLVDRASRHDDSKRDCDLSGRLGPGKRAVIVGDPGCGKSTLLQWLAHYYGSRWQEPSRPSDDTGLPVHDWLPILISCRDLLGQPLPATLADLLRAHLRLRQFSGSSVGDLADHMERLLERGRAILLIDGLDEIPQAAARVEFSKLLIAIANRFPKAPLFATSRVVGFQAVQDLMASEFDHLVVGPLDNAAKQAFIDRWGQLTDWDRTVIDELISRVCYSRVTAKLTDNILLLAMVAQMRAVDGTLPDRRVDVYRRAVDIMLRRQRPFDGPPLTANEVIPHLEFLAYSMRRSGIQRMLDVDAVAIFNQLRRLEPDETSLTLRRPQELLQACIASLGLVSVAGTATDEKGYDRLMVQFFHQSFQEYFAAQAIKYGRGGIGGNVESVVRIRAELAKLKIAHREVNIFGRFKLNEPVLADNWQEVVRMLVADLPANEADDAILMLLPGPGAPSDEARPRAVFALQCLAEEPPVSDATVESVFDAAIDAFAEGDGFNKELNTWMDEALAAAGGSRFGAMLHARLIGDFTRARGNLRRRIGCCTMVLYGNKDCITPATADAVIAKAKHGLTAKTPKDRVPGALRLVNQLYLADGKLGFLEAAQRSRLFEILSQALDTDEATLNAAMWALIWLCDARYRDKSPDNRSLVSVPPAIARRIEAIMQKPDVDAVILADGANILTREEGGDPIFGQQDWIYDLAVIADGGSPRRKLKEVKPCGRTLPIDWLVHRVITNYPSGPGRGDCAGGARGFPARVGRSARGLCSTQAIR